MGTVFLFDIDGTILSSGGAGRRAMMRAFEERTGEALVGDFSYAGMTDRAIARRGLSNAGQDPNDAAIDALIAAYLRNLPQEVESTPRYQVFDGIRSTLDRLAHRAEVAFGLGTGNVREGARLKLGPAGLFERFSFGGFGCDHEDRAELLRIGAERGAAQLGRPRASCRVVVVGDTVRDVVAAHAVGAECVAVLTGGIPFEQLSEAGADVIVEDLTADEAQRALLG